MKESCAQGACSDHGSRGCLSRTVRAGLPLTRIHDLADEQDGSRLVVDDQEEEG